MKVVFLDIDGVINTVGAELGFNLCYGIEPNGENIPLRKRLSELFDPACLYYLRQIVEDTGCKIVVSSTWRHGETTESMKEWFTCPVIREAIIDKTPSFGSLSYPELKDRRGRVQRGEEIKWWVDQHPEVTRYAVLDDDSDMDAVYNNFFKTCTYDGLKRDVAYKVITHLNNEELLDHYRMNHNLTKFLAELRSCFGDVSGYKEVENEIVQRLKLLNYRYQNKQEMKG